MTRDYTLAAAAVLLGAACCAWGLFGTIDTALHGANEWAGIAIAAVYVVCIPGGIIATVVARLIRARALRRLGLTIGLAAVAMPLVMSATIRVRSELRRRELERQTQQILRDRGIVPPKR